MVLDLICVLVNSIVRLLMISVLSVYELSDVYEMVQIW